MARYFLRCVGCLEVMAVDVEAAPSALRCGMCASVIEVMGRVERDRLVEDVTACACDERCTCARGPICSCKCNGENHGAGLAAVIRYTIDKGAVPVVLPSSMASRAAALARFKEYIGWRTELEAIERGSEFARKAAARRVLKAAAASKIHSRRITMLRKAVGRPVMASLF